MSFDFLHFLRQGMGFFLWDGQVCDDPEGAGGTAVFDWKSLSKKGKRGREI
jgi:hypothetical protein